MRSKHTISVIVALLVGLFSSASTAQATAATVLHCGKLFDGRQLTLLGEHTIRIEGNRIASVQRGLQTPTGAAVVDLKSHTCMPGLIDLHVHLTLDTLTNVANDIA